MLDPIGIVSVVSGAVTVPKTSASSSPALAAAARRRTGRRHQALLFGVHRAHHLARFHPVEICAADRAAVARHFDIDRGHADHRDDGAGGGRRGRSFGLTDRNAEAACPIHPRRSAPVAASGLSSK